MGDGFIGLDSSYADGAGPPAVVAGSIVLYTGAQSIGMTLPAGWTLHASASALIGSFTANFSFSGYVVDQ